MRTHNFFAFQENNTLLCFLFFAFFLLYSHFPSTQLSSLLNAGTFLLWMQFITFSLTHTHAPKKAYALKLYACEGHSLQTYAHTHTSAHARAKTPLLYGVGTEHCAKGRER